MSHTFFLYVFSVPHFSSSQENSQRKNELLLETTSKIFTILKTTDQVLCTTQWPWATNCYHTDNLFQSQFLQNLWVVFSQSLQTCKICRWVFPFPQTLQHMRVGVFNSPLPCNKCGWVSFNSPKLARYVGGCFSIPPELARYACRWVFFNPPQNLQEMLWVFFNTPETCKICGWVFFNPPKTCKIWGWVFFNPPEPCKICLFSVKPEI